MLTKILIADGNIEFRRALTDRLQPECQVRTCDDGSLALELLRSYRPDFLVLDLMLSGLDGLSVLQTATEEGICPHVLVTSSFLGSYVTSALQRYDVVYVVPKPCQISAVVCRIRDLVSQLPPPLFHPPSPHSLVSAVLMELSMRSSHNGYHYCRQAILMLAKNPSLQVTKSVYPVIAKQYGCNIPSVEKGIRDAITAAWDNRSDQVWRRYFPTVAGQIPRPSNRVFLSTLAEVLFSVNELAI